MISFMHVPKTGGISFMHSVHDKNFPVCCFGHKSFFELETCDNARDHEYVTFFRDPYDLAVSKYFYETKYENLKSSLNDYLDSYDPIYAKYVDIDNVSDIKFVGTLENYNRSIHIFNKMFGTSLVAHFDNVKDNKQPGAGYKTSYSRKTFIDNNKEDYEIYYRGVKKYEELNKFYG